MGSLYYLFCFFGFTIFIITLQKNNNYKNSHQLRTSGHSLTGLEPAELPRCTEPGTGQCGEVLTATRLWGGGAPRAPWSSRWVFPPHSQECILAPGPPGGPPTAGGHSETALHGTGTSPHRLGRLHASSKPRLPLPLVPFPHLQAEQPERALTSSPVLNSLNSRVLSAPVSSSAGPFPSLPLCFLLQGLIATGASPGFANIYSAPVKSCIPGPPQTSAGPR